MSSVLGPRASIFRSRSSVLGPWRSGSGALNQVVQLPADVFALGQVRLQGLLSDESEVGRDEELCLCLQQRPTGYAVEVALISCGPPSLAFCDVAHDGHRRP